MRPFGWVAGLVGIAALARLLARREARRERAALAPGPEADPAEALRRKLSETRVTGQEEGALHEDAAEVRAPAETLEERRARVHARAQEAIEAMQQEPPA